MGGLQARTPTRNDWTMKADTGDTSRTSPANTSKVPSAAEANDFICRGTFIAPKKSGSSVYTAVYIQCAPAAAVIASAALDKCTRVGGPDDFSCITVARGHASSPGKANQLLVPVYYSPCKSGHYRPRAYYRTVNGIDYPDELGNITSVTC